MHRGKLLVARPNLKGSIFSKSVIYVYQDASIGINGVVLNKPSDWQIDYIFDYKGFDYYKDDFVYLGGPVSTQAITLLHTDDFYSSNTVPIGNGISISSDNFMFEKISQNNEPQDWRMFIGICGWYPGQLESEMQKDQSWLLTDANPDIIFNYAGEEQWEQAIELCSQNMVDSFFA